MKKTIVTLIMSIAALAAVAATNPPIAITGNMDIKYNSKTALGKGVKDVYTVNVNFGNSSLFHGTITDTPQIIDGWINKTVVQPRSLDYDIALDVVNPRNIAQTKNVGKLYGVVPISSDGVYHYDTGSLLVDVLPMGNAGGFTSKFDGVAAGKPLTRPSNWQDRVMQAVSITRQINGKTTTVVLKKYDKMEFRQHKVAAGPVAIYQQAEVNGEMLYDYSKNCWFFNSFTLQYPESGTVKIDRITGTIRWVDAPDHDYQFDVRVNEPPPSDNATFSAPSDEASFFETDTSIPALTGTMKYKDTLQGDQTIASQVVIDLATSNLTKQQAMLLTKLIIFSCVVPFNSD